MAASALVALLACCHLSAEAQTPTPSVEPILVGPKNGLEWDANTEPDLERYRVYLSQTPGIAPRTVDVVAPTHELDFAGLNLLNGPWTASVTAMDVLGNESEKSDTVAFAYDATAPGVPKNLKIKIVVTIP